VNRSAVGRAFLGLGGLGLAVYIAIVGTQSNSSDPLSFLMPHSWVWWVVAPTVVCGVVGFILGRSERAPRADEPPAAVTHGISNSTFHGPVNINQNSVVQPHTRVDLGEVHAAPAQTTDTTTPTSVSRPARIVPPYTRHVGLESHLNMRTSVRTVRWASNDREVGTLHPSARGGGYDVIHASGDELGGVADEKAGMERLKHHDTQPPASPLGFNRADLLESLREQADLLKCSFGEYPTLERGKSLEQSILLLENRLPAAFSVADRLAKQMPSTEVRNAVNHFKDAWRRVLQLDLDYERYDQDKRTPGVQETKETIDGVWAEAVGAIGVIEDAVGVDQEHR
jgi:hypothetical protein